MNEKEYQRKKRTVEADYHRAMNKLNREWLVATEEPQKPTVPTSHELPVQRRIEVVPEKFVISVETVTNALRDYKSLLDIYVKDNCVVVKPVKYLHDEFRPISSIIRDVLNGEYVSAGRDSYFRIPL